MAPIVKLLQGKDTLDLNSGRYCIEDSDFLPPTTAREVTFGRAAVGQNLASKRRANRSWGFSVNIDAASISEAERALRDLQAFLNRAGENRSDPLFVAYRAWNDHTYEPFFGQFGALARYEIVSANAELASEYLNPLANSKRVVRVAVDLVIKPQALGIPQRAGQAKGRIYENFLGQADGIPRGVWIEDSVGAPIEFTNPAFMSTTAYDNGWSTGGTGTSKARNTDPNFVQVGTRSLKFTSKQTDNSATLHQSVSVVNTSVYWLTALVKRRDGGAISSSQLGFVFTGTAGNTYYIALGNGWYYCVGGFTATSTASVNCGFYWNSPVPAYFDLCSITRSTKPRYPLKSAGWGAYTTANTSGTLNYKGADFFPARNQWTIRIVWRPPPDSSATRYFLTTGDIVVYINSSNQVVAASSGAGTLTSSAITVTAGTPIVLHVTYNGDTLTIYNAGSSIGTASGHVAANNDPSAVTIGSDAVSANYCYGTIMGIATFAEVMTAAQVSADYTQVAQMVTDDQRIDPLPYLWTKDGDDIIDNEQTTAGRNFTFLSGMMGDDVDTEVYGIVADASDNAWSSTKGLTFGSLPTPPGFHNCLFYDDEDSLRLFAVDGAGTADTAANNDVVERQSLNTTALEYCDTAEQSVFFPAVRGREVYALATVKDAGSNLQLRLAVVMGKEKFYSTWRNVTASGAFYSFLLGPVTIPDYPKIIDVEQQIGFAVEAKRSTAGAANLDMSHALYLMNSTYLDATKLQVPSGADSLYMKGREAVVALSTATATAGLGRAALLARPLTIRPNRINGLLVQLTTDTNTWVSVRTIDFDKISVTPRWDIY